MRQRRALGTRDSGLCKLMFASRRFHFPSSGSCIWLVEVQFPVFLHYRYGFGSMVSTIKGH